MSMITRAEQLYISGADWVGIMGMAYKSIAAVSIICLGGAALCCSYLAFKAPGSNKFWNLLSVYYTAEACLLHWTETRKYRSELSIKSITVITATMISLHNNPNNFDSV